MWFPFLKDPPQVHPNERGGDKVSIRGPLILLETGRPKSYHEKIISRTKSHSLPWKNTRNRSCSIVSRVSLPIGLLKQAFARKLKVIVFQSVTFAEGGVRT